MQTNFAVCISARPVSRVHISCSSWPLHIFMKLIRENVVTQLLNPHPPRKGKCFLIVKIQVVENDRLRNGNREALTALRKKARTTKTSVPSPFDSIMKEIVGQGSKTLVQEVCPTCGNHDATENMWMMFPGTDVFAQVPFHAAHTILEEGVLLLHFSSFGILSHLVCFYIFLK